MQKERLTLKLPMEPLVLTHAGEMLLSMAGQMELAAAAPADLGKGIMTVAGARETLSGQSPLADNGACSTTLPPPNTAGAGNLPPAAGVTLDDAKRPWDNRIHGSGKTFLKTGDRAGCWKYKKQLDPALIASVEAELDAAMAVVAPAAVPPPPVTTVTTETTEPPAMDFPGIVNKVTALQNAGRITPEQIQTIVTAAGLPSFPLLGSRPDLIPAVNVEIDKLCPPTQ